MFKHLEFDYDLDLASWVFGAEYASEESLSGESTDHAVIFHVGPLKLGWIW